MPRIELNGEGEPVWLTPHLRDPQPEGERVLRPVPVRSCEEENAIPPTSRPASQGSKASQGSRASRLSECVGQIGTTVAGVVQDMLAAHKEDNDSRQQVQLQMMLVQREEAELRLIEAQKSACTVA